MSCRAESKN